MTTTPDPIALVGSVLFDDGSVCFDKPWCLAHGGRTEPADSAGWYFPYFSSEMIDPGRRLGWKATLSRTELLALSS